MADFDSSGSGDGTSNGAGTGRTAWDSPDSEPDDDGTGSNHGFSDSELDGSGSGHSPASDSDWEETSKPSRDGGGNHKSGKMTMTTLSAHLVASTSQSMTFYLHLGSDEFELNGETTPRVTVKEPTGGSSSGRASISAALLAICLILTLNLHTWTSSSFRPFFTALPSYIH